MEQESADLDYLLSSVSGAAGAVPTTVSPVTTALPAAVPVAPSLVPSAGPASAATATASTSAVAPDEASPGGNGATSSKKRPLAQEDKKARERKRVLRNRELARVSNERRKGRIKAMESELNETRATVATLEDSIRCLEAENKELKQLLQGKNPGAASVQPQQTTGPGHTVPQGAQQDPQTQAQQAAQGAQ